MSGNAPVPPPPPHSEPAPPPAYQPAQQQPAVHSPAPTASPSAWGDQGASAYTAQQPAYQPPAQQQATAYQPQQPAAPQQPAYQAPPPAFAPGSGQQPAYAPQQAAQPAYQQQAPQPGYQPQQPAYQQQAPQPAYQQQAPQPAYQQQAPQPAYAPQPAGSPPGGGSGKKRSRLSPGWIAFIAVDVILVGIVIAFAINLATGSTGADVPEGPGTVAQSPATVPEAPLEQPGPVEISGESVTSPSRNITCTLGDQGVSCEIAELASQPAPVEGCNGTTGYVVTLTATGVDIPCVPAADQPEKADEDVPVLDYDQAKTVGSYTCTSSKSGMRCTDSETGKGFTLAKAGLSSF